ncbi:30S ribosomal protein S9 [Patescibacteria group bacterium]|nr:30S ribosomal protein S9 [Patescibacteria group bacterium]
MAPKKKEKFIEAVGRRKTAVARIRIIKDSKSDFVVNDKPMDEYFQEKEQQYIAKQSLILEKTPTVSAKVRGGGMRVQAEAVRQGIARALVKSDGELRSELKALGFLTRDPRKRERKKFGLKRARRARQWRKR